MFDGEDLIFDQRTLEGLGNLYNSLVCPRYVIVTDDSNGLFGIYEVCKELKQEGIGLLPSTFLASITLN